MDVTHFSMIGFVYEGEAGVGMDRLMRSQLQHCTPQLVDAANVLCVVVDPSGAELRIGLRKDKDGVADLVTMNPAFKGEGRARLQIDRDNTDPNYARFEIGRAARFQGEETPVIFELADPGEAAAIKPGGAYEISLVAFSYAPEIHESARSYFDAQRRAGATITMAPNFFIPSGTFFERVGGAMPDDSPRPVSYADFAGKVVRASLKRNAAGAASFWWVLAETYEGATVDVVIDPSTIKVEPKPGNIVTGRFWMSGRLARQP